MRLALLTTGLVGAAAYNNGMGKKPPMGWQTWCSVGKCGEDHCFDGQIRAMADTLADPIDGKSMKDLGYNWVILDDCWHPSRDNKTGELVPYPRFFPDGMKPVIDYVHSKGLKFGLYTSVGDRTCHGGWSPGSCPQRESNSQSPEPARPTCPPGDYEFASLQGTGTTSRTPTRSPSGRWTT